MGFRDESSFTPEGRGGGAMTNLLARVRGPFVPDAEARCALAITRAQGGQVGESRQLLEEARLIEPLSLMSYHLRLQLESQAGAPGEGDRWMRRHARVEFARNRGRPLSPADLSHAQGRVQLQLDRARPFDAMDILEDLLVADLSSPSLATDVLATLYHQLAALQLLMGDREAAWRNLTSAVLLQPDEPEIVHRYLEGLPWSLVPEKVPDPTPAAWGIADDAAASALTSAGIVKSQVTQFLKRLDRLPPTRMDMLELGPALPVAFLRTVGARSVTHLAPATRSDIQGMVSTGPLDLDQVADKGYDRVYVHDLPGVDPVEVMTAVRRGLRRGGRALVRLGPAWTSPRGHGLAPLVDGIPIPDWYHLLWTPAQREAFSKTAELDVSRLQPTGRKLGAQVLIEAITESRLKVLSLTPTERTFPSFHIRLRLTEHLPHVENFHDAGFEALLEKP